MRRWIARAALVCGSIALAASALAQVPVIPPGREDEIRALFAPYALGGEVTPGWTLDGIEIRPGTIEAQLRSASARASLTLHHPEHGPEGAITTPSFAVSQRGGAESEPARAALLDALRENDRGTFWSADPVVASPTPASLDGLSLEQLRFGRRSSPLVPVLLGSLALIGAALALVRQRSRSARRAGPSSAASSERQGGNTGSE